MAFLLLASAVACIAWTVTQEEVFRELRDWLCNIRDGEQYKWWCRKLAYLPTCHYCFSHYVAAALILWTGIKIADSFVVTWFVAVWVANFEITIYHTLRQALKFVRLRATKEAV